MSVTFQKLLSEELCERQKRRPNYSMRAFAQHLDISPSTLSSYINGKARPAVIQIKRIAAKLGWSARELAAVIKEVQEARLRREPFDMKNLADLQLKPAVSYLCILMGTLPQLKEHQSDVTWIAQRFSADVRDVRNAKKTLLAHSILVEEDGRFRPGAQPCVWIDNENEESTIQMEEIILNNVLSNLHEPSDVNKVFLGAHITCGSSDLPEVAVAFNRLARSLKKKMSGRRGDGLYSVVLATVPAGLARPKARKS